jgi:sugar phosphate isomerase/epimerase
MQLIERAAELDFDCVQIADNMPLHFLTSAQLRELKMLADEKAIAIEVGTRGLTYDNVRRYLDIAGTLGSPVLRIVIDLNDYQPEIGIIVEIVNTLLPELRAMDVKLAVENHDRLPAVRFLEIIRQTDEHWVGICLDSVNSIGADEGFRQVADLLLPYTINLHLKDYCIRRMSHMMGFVVEGTPAGAGRLAIPWLFEQLRHYNRCQSAILELWPSPETDLQSTIEKEARWIEESMAYLKGIRS